MTTTTITTTTTTSIESKKSSNICVFFSKSYKKKERKSETQIMRKMDTKDCKNSFIMLCELTNKIQDIPNYNLYFIICNKIEKTKNENNYIMTIESKENIHMDFDDYFILLHKQKRNLTGYILYSYMYLLRSINLLKVHKLYDKININREDIVFNKHNNSPLLKICFDDYNVSKKHQNSEYSLNNIYLNLLKVLNQNKEFDKDKELNKEFKTFFSLFLNLNKEKEAEELLHLLENTLDSNPFPFFT